MSVRSGLAEHACPGLTVSTAATDHDSHDVYIFSAKFIPACIKTILIILQKAPEKKNRHVPQRRYLPGSGPEATGTTNTGKKGRPECRKRRNIERFPRKKVVSSQGNAFVANMPGSSLHPWAPSQPAPSTSPSASKSLKATRDETRTHRIPNCCQMPSKM